MRKNHHTGSVSSFATTKAQVCRRPSTRARAGGRRGEGGRGRGVLEDVRALGGAEARQALGHVVERQPEHEPHEAGETRGDEGRAPAERRGEPGHDRRRDDRAHVGARVEERRRERALALGEPERDGLDGRREVAALADAERDAREEEAADAAHERVAEGGQAPHRDRDGVADLGAGAIDEARRRRAARRRRPPGRRR
jgi:hypothetical protein